MSICARLGAGPRASVAVLLILAALVAAYLAIFWPWLLFYLTVVMGLAVTMTIHQQRGWTFEP